MGCRQSTAAGASSASPHGPMRPSTPSFAARESIAAARDAPEELPSFVLSTTSDLVKSSDSEAVQGMVGAFTFSFIQVSEASSSSSDSVSVSASGSDQDESSAVVDQMPAISEDVAAADDEDEETRSIVAAVVDELVAGTAVVAARNDHHARLSVVTNDSDDVKEYLVTETGDVQAVTSEEHAAGVSSTTNAVVSALVGEVIQNAIDGEPETTSKADSSSQRALRASAPRKKTDSTITNPSSVDPYELTVSSFGGPEMEATPEEGDVPEWKYAIVGHSVSDDDVVLYQIQLTNGLQSKWPKPVQKRYSEFKQFHRKLEVSDLESASDLPRLPRAGVTQFVRGRLSKRTIEQRELCFSELLRFITQHPSARSSALFRDFINQ